MSISNSASLRQTEGVPDAHGHAALMLVESLIHTLVDSEAMTLVSAVDCIDVAADVTSELLADRPEHSAGLEASHALLTAISSSLAKDLP